LPQALGPVWDTRPPPGPVRAYSEVVVCPSYIAPEHGSVWQAGVEHRVATSSGTPAGGSVAVRCHEGFRPSRVGSSQPKCMPNGEWEVGKSCERVYCPPYEAPEHGSVSFGDPVAVGASVHITCDTYYELSRPEAASPKCLATGGYEEGSGCKPKPCPKEPGPVPCIRPTGGSRRGHGRFDAYTHPTKDMVREWEDDFEHEMTSDYAPNVFDHEPRPTTWQT